MTERVSGVAERVIRMTEWVIRMAGGWNRTLRVFAGVPSGDSQGWGGVRNLHLSWYGSPCAGWDG